MRLVLLAALLAAVSFPAAAAAAPAPRCDAREANLGGIGRAGVVAFTGPVTGAPACATFANVAIDGFTARIARVPAPDALVVATLSGGGELTLPLDGAAVDGAGPYLIAPGGTIQGFGADVSEAPRVVFAYAGQRVLVIATSAVALDDLALLLRRQPALFGSDAIERAVLLASGPGAALVLRTTAGDFGTVPDAAPARFLELIKRG